MKNPPKPERYNQEPDIQQEADLAYRQALQYGQDLVEIYKQERQKRKALEMAYKKLEVALESMSEGFLVISADLTILEINQACADLFELSPESAEGKPLSEVLVSTETESFCDRLQNGKTVKFKRQLDLVLPVPRTVTIQAGPLPDGGWILVLHNVTWEHRVNNMREEFLHLAAHELRTPLAAVMGFTSMLEQIGDSHGLDADAKSILASILKATDKLRNAIKDMVDFTLRDTKETDVEPLDLRIVLEDALTLLQKQAAEHNISMLIYLPDEPMMVYGHKEMLTTALGHLIENGILYNEKGGTLTITGQSNQDTYSLIFTDSGKGIARTDYEHILKPFYQVEAHTIRRSVGMGLGLSIVQRTLTLHRGTLSLESKLGEGSSFTITLPRFTAEDLTFAREEWLAIQNSLSQQATKQEVEERYNAQTLINQLKSQLEVTQTQNVAYAKDLAKLYQNQRAGAEKLEAQKAQTSHTDRLALMGQLAAGVAHDLSNLIGPILGYSQIILRSREAIDPNMADIIERILGASRRANGLLRQMVSLSKTGNDDFSSFNLNQLSKEILQLLELKIKHANIELIESYTEDKINVYGNATQISQVILNIVINAIDAMPDGGLLTIKTSPAGRDNKPYSQIQISDTGQGIDPKNIPLLFDAFFTTKQKTSGTGLGLSITKQIVDNHNGYITVDSVIGKGTTFTVLLPAPEENYDSTE